MKRLILLMTLLLGLIGCQSEDLEALTEREKTYIDNNETLKISNHVLKNELDSNRVELTNVLSDYRTLESDLEVSELALIGAKSKHKILCETFASSYDSLDASDVEEIIRLLPEGYLISKKNNMNLAIAKGDLNDDDREDLAYVIVDKATSNRNLMIAFSRDDGAYEVETIANKAILNEFSGGGYGDPLDNIAIRDGLLKLDFFGGSSERFFMTYDFLYDDKQFSLVHAISGYHIDHNGERVVVQKDYDFKTGQSVVTEIIDGVLETHTVYQSVKNLISIETFIAGPDENY